MLIFASFVTARHICMCVTSLSRHLARHFVSISVWGTLLVYYQTIGVFKHDTGFNFSFFYLNDILQFKKKKMQNGKKSLLIQNI